MLILWIKPILTLLALALLSWFLPTKSIDPWNLLNPQKVTKLIFALAFIQIFGFIVNRILGPRAGAIMTGFFGGLISSTATTASLARKSKGKDLSNDADEMLIFVSATAAMLVESIVLVWLGTSHLQLFSLIIFLSPLFVTAVMIFIYYKEANKNLPLDKEIEFKILPFLKLTIFIVTILALSQMLKKLFGQKGLMIFTFFVSLFEIHGSIIANIQLHESGAVKPSLLSYLLAISILASFLSKLFLVSALGSKSLRIKVAKCTFLLFLALLLGVVLSTFLI
jgi:uncharacterized membrane protein (DUF4010 family)